MSQKQASGSGTEASADAPVVEPVKDAKAGGGQTAEAKPLRTRLHRGQTCPIIRTTKNVLTGAIYDLILYTRNVTNRKNGTSAPATVGKKLRRPGTGTVDAEIEVDITAEEEMA